MVKRLLIALICIALPLTQASYGQRIAWEAVFTSRIPVADSNVTGNYYYRVNGFCHYDSTTAFFGHAGTCYDSAIGQTFDPLRITRMDLRTGLPVWSRFLQHPPGTKRVDAEIVDIVKAPEGRLWVGANYAYRPTTSLPDFDTVEDAMLIMLIDTTGRVLWRQKILPKRPRHFTQILGVTSKGDGRALVHGYNDTEVLAMEVLPDGLINWRADTTNSTFRHSAAYYAQPRAGKGWVLSAREGSGNFGRAMFIDSTGRFEREEVYFPEYTDGARYVQTGDGGSYWIVSARTPAPNANTKIVVERRDSAGRKLWGGVQPDEYSQNRLERIVPYLTVPLADGAVVVITKQTSGGSPSFENRSSLVCLEPDSTVRWRIIVDSANFGTNRVRNYREIKYLTADFEAYASGTVIVAGTKDWARYYPWVAKIENFGRLFEPVQTKKGIETGALKLSLYPNPARAGEVITLSLSESKGQGMRLERPLRTSEISNLHLVNMEGKRVSADLNKAGAITLPNSLDKGVYVLSCQTATGMPLSKRLVVD